MRCPLWQAQARSSPSLPLRFPRHPCVLPESPLSRSLVNDPELRGPSSRPREAQCRVTVPMMLCARARVPKLRRWGDVPTLCVRARVCTTQPEGSPARIRFSPVYSILMRRGRVFFCCNQPAQWGAREYSLGWRLRQEGLEFLLDALTFSQDLIQDTRDVFRCRALFNVFFQFRAKTRKPLCTKGS